jgi:hypothetical protein
VSPARAEPLLVASRDAYKDGDFVLAMARAKAAGAAGGGEAAFYLVAAAACKLRRLDEARSSYRRLGAAKQAVARRLCAEVGLELE